MSISIEQLSMMKNTNLGNFRIHYFFISPSGLGMSQPFKFKFEQP